ncbi:MAG: hypothetical protein R3C12_09945 [Planctomycetaceae bacterium]
MSILARTNPRLEMVSDWMNPILVKETRQALKSRQFVATFLLVLFACWVICLIGVAMLGSRIEYGAPSTGFLQGFFQVLSVAVIIAIPFSSYRSLLGEQDAQTYELLSITSLSPRQIVWGKLLNAVVQILVLYSAVAPFVAFTSLLQGFDLPRTLLVLLLLFGLSVFLCMATLMLSTVSRNRQVQVLSTLFVLGGLIAAYSMMSAGFTAIIQGFVDLDTDFYLGILTFVLIGLSYFVLFLQISISQLMFDAANKATGVRLVATCQFLLFWLLPSAYNWFYGVPLNKDLLETIAVYSLIHWGVFGFFVAMERDYLSRRVRRDLPRRGLIRLLAIPFLPGGTRGYLLVLLNLLTLLALLQFNAHVWAAHANSSFLQAFQAALAYTVIYLGLGCLLTRWLLRVSQEMQPLHGRTILIVLIALGTILPYFILWGLGHYDTYHHTYSLLQITNPFETMAEVELSGSESHAILSVLGLGVLTVVGLNFLPILRACGEILWPRRPSRSVSPDVTLSEA